MADFTNVYNAQQAAYQEIWDKAQDALDSLKQASTSGYIDASAAPVEPVRTVATLAFDPGPPKPLTMSAGPVSAASLISKIDGWINKINAIKAPVFPTQNIKMEDHEIWDDVFADKIKTNLTTYIDSMGIPDVTYQNAIFNEDYDRNLTILNDLYELADAKTGAKGFTYTNAYSNSLKLDAQVKYQFDRVQISRSISKVVTEWARENYQFAIDKGIVFEQAQMDFTYKYCTASVEIYKSMITAELDKYKAYIEANLAPAEAYIKELLAVLDYTKVAADIDKTNETLKQSRSEIEIKEASEIYAIEMNKYQANTTSAINRVAKRFEALQYMAGESAGIAQATTNSVIATMKG